MTQDSLIPKTENYKRIERLLHDWSTFNCDAPGPADARPAVSVRGDDSPVFESPRMLNIFGITPTEWQAMTDKQRSDIKRRYDLLKVSYKRLDEALRELRALGQRSFWTIVHDYVLRPSGEGGNALREEQIRRHLAYIGAVGWLTVYFQVHGWEPYAEFPERWDYKRPPSMPHEEWRQHVYERFQEVLPTVGYKRMEAYKKLSEMYGQPKRTIRDWVSRAEKEIKSAA